VVQQLSVEVRFFNNYINILENSKTLRFTFDLGSIQCGVKKTFQKFYFFSRFSASDPSLPAEVALIDLQRTQLGRIGFDLTYFLSSSASPLQREQHFDALLGLYYRTFCSELGMLGIEQIPLTFDELLQEYDACFPYGFAMGLLHTQVVFFHNPRLKKLLTNFSDFV
jgi:hypothetical protein